MLENIVTALTVSLVTAMVYVAYKHHAGYLKICRVLSIAVGVATPALMVGIFAYQAGFYDATGQISNGIKNPVYHSPSGLVFFAPWLLLTFLQVLRYIPDVLEIPKEDR